MRVLLKMYGKLEAYESNCLQYTDEVAGDYSKHGLYIETSDDHDDGDWIFVPMDEHVAFEFIRQVAVVGYVDLTEYKAYNVDSNEEIDYGTDDSIFESYFESVGIQDASDKCSELDRLRVVFATQDDEQLAREIQDKLMPKPIPTIL